VLDGGQLRVRISGYVDAVNSRDPEAIAELFADDAVHADPVSNPPNRGRAAIATFFEQGIGASDGWTFTARAVHTCSPSVAVDFAIDVDTAGSTMTIEGIEVFVTDDDGLFRSVHAYWDDADLTFG
jgi:uncharacterized protein (TIGR02246 family)